MEAHEINYVFSIIKHLFFLWFASKEKAITWTNTVFIYIFSHHLKEYDILSVTSKCRFFLFSFFSYLILDFIHIFYFIFKSSVYLKILIFFFYSKHKTWWVFSGNQYIKLQTLPAEPFTFAGNIWKRPDHYLPELIF